MRRIKLSVKKNNVNGEYYISSKRNNHALILILGNERLFPKAIARYLKKFNINVLGVYPFEKEKHYFKFASYPLERIESCISFLKEKGITSIGIATASSWSVLGLSAASTFKDISCCIALTPIDYIVEGLYQGKKQHMLEWPSSTSCLSYNGKDLPYHSYGLEENDYWKKFIHLKKENKEIHMLEIYNEAENNPIKEDEFIKVEKINGPLFLAGAKDDSMWECVRYIERIEERLKKNNFKFDTKIYKYDYGTHFIFPEAILKKLGSIGGEYITKKFQSGKKHKKECKETRKDISIQLESFLTSWVNSSNNEVKEDIIKNNEEVPKQDVSTDSK